MKLFDKHNAFRDLRNGFIAGVALLLPIVVTVFVVHFLVTRVGEPAGEFIIRALYPGLEIRSSPLQYGINAVATLIVFIVITGLGFFSRYFIGKWVLAIGERIITVVPLVNIVYTTVKQIVDTFSEQQKAIFQKVVMIEYPKKECYAIGFLTSESK